jgi:hypothetical protein
VPYSAACLTSTGAQSVSGWLNDGISVKGLGQGFRTGGVEPQAGGAVMQTGSAWNRTLEVIARTHQSVRSSDSGELETNRTTGEGTWPVPTTRRPSMPVPDDRNGEAEVRRVRSQEDPRRRNRATEPTESREDAGLVTKPREEETLGEGGSLHKMPSLTLRSVGPVRGNCTKEGTAGYVDVRWLGEPAGGSRRREFNDGRSSGSRGPGDQDRTDRAEQASTSEIERTPGRGTTPTGEHAGPDRKEGLN